MWGMSWYRLYRPQTVSSLHIVPVREAFQRILDIGEFSHAYLLAGPKGTGKTSGARILAKILNCEKNRKVVEAQVHGKTSTTKGKKKETKPLLEPCNTCPTCLAITSGTSLCVTEMDGASNRGIDDIRELTAKVGLSAGDGLVNVVIIDEVHMLTVEAFNALLKVLEEPPSHVVFILATTDVQKMPPTVISRCQVIPYRKALAGEIVAALTDIADTETIEVEDEVLPQIVSFADGSFRDAVKAFEQIGKGKTKVTLADVVNILGKSVREISEMLLQRLSKGNVAGVVEIFLQLSVEGTDLLIVQKEVLRSLHERMVLAPGSKSPHFPTYLSLLTALNVPPSSSLPFPGLPFEVACLQWCVGRRPVGAKKTQIETAFAKPPKQAVPVRKEKIKAVVETIKEEAEKVGEMEVTEPEREKEDSSVPIEFTSVLSRWHEVLRGVHEKNPSIEALLKTTKPLKIEANQLVIEVFYQFHKEQLEGVRNFNLIKNVLTGLFATSLKPIFVLGEKGSSAAKLPDSNVSGVVDLSFVKAAEDAFLS